MAASVDPLVVGRVIGDVVDMFIPSLSVSVYFGSRHVMIDPDAPSPSEPSMREWVHWIVVDIPGGTNPNRDGPVDQSDSSFVEMNIGYLINDGSYKWVKRPLRVPPV
ncbi:hypothetical protein TIFTF001_052084 [Ficus carica]|uniref:Uncharacterized protein n=1 Tax=Ficus carica TaxID=3494 RepID=A0AA88EF29_FICCA|nr:hypothetical protein TIFTF001_052084 [Ficus carica]